MSLSIRLARAGAHKKPFYRVVVADKRMPRDGRFLEKIGTYDPLLADKRQRVRLSVERAQHWMARGAKPSRRVALFLHEVGVGDKPAVPQQTKKSLPRKKEQERRAAQQKPAAQQPAAQQPAAQQAETVPASSSPAPSSPDSSSPDSSSPASSSLAPSSPDSSSDDTREEKND